MKRTRTDMEKANEGAAEASSTGGGPGCTEELDEVSNTVEIVSEPYSVENVAEPYSVENAAEPFTWEQMDKVLSQQGLRTTDRGGFPDCFFHCVVWQLKKANLQPLTVAELRYTVADYLTERYPNGPDTLAHIIEEVDRVQPRLKLESWADYLQELRSGTLYASELEIDAVCQLYQVTITLYTLNNNREALPQVHGERDDGVTPVTNFLLAFLPSHYRTVDRDRPRYQRIRGDAVPPPPVRSLRIAFSFGFLCAPWWDLYSSLHRKSLRLTRSSMRWRSSFLGILAAARR